MSVLYQIGDIVEFYYLNIYKASGRILDIKDKIKGESGEYLKEYLVYVLDDVVGFLTENGTRKMLVEKDSEITITEDSFYFDIFKANNNYIYKAPAIPSYSDLDYLNNIEFNESELKRLPRLLEIKGLKNKK